MEQSFRFLIHETRIYICIELVSFQKEFPKLWVTSKWHQAMQSLTECGMVTDSSHPPSSKLE